MKLECFTLGPDAPEMVPGRLDREWMDDFAGRVPYRCLPLTMANTTGWEILTPFSFTAEWNGGPGTSDITLTADNPRKPLDRLVQSHFAGGVITFHTGYLFRTPPGWGMVASGAPNHIKHGLHALTGLVETDWLPFPFTMNWIFTAPGRVRFEKGEPFCFITLTQHQKVERFDPVIRALEDSPDLEAQYQAWNKSRSEFIGKLAEQDPDALRASWQRHYFRGEPPEQAGPKPSAHSNKRRLKAPRVQAGGGRDYVIKARLRVEPED